MGTHLFIYSRCFLWKFHACICVFMLNYACKQSSICVTKFASCILNRDNCICVYVQYKLTVYNRNGVCVCSFCAGLLQGWQCCVCIFSCVSLDTGLCWSQQCVRHQSFPNSCVQQDGASRMPAVCGTALYRSAHSHDVRDG